MNQKYRDILEKFQQIVGGAGNIYPCTAGWMWRTGHFEDVQFIVCLLWPWLSQRKKNQAIRVLKKYHFERAEEWRRYRESLKSQ